FISYPATTTLYSLSLHDALPIFIDHCLEELPVLLEFRHPVIIKPKTLAICTKAMMFQLLVEIIENFLAIVNGLINRMAEVGHKGVIKTLAKGFKFRMTLGKNMVLVTIVKLVEMTADLADLT